MNNEEEIETEEELNNSSYDINNDLEGLDNSYYDSDYETNKDLDDNSSDNDLLNEPAPEEMESSGLGAEGEIFGAKAVIKKGAWEFLKKNPWFWGIIALAIFFFVIFLLALQGDFDLVGRGNPKLKYYTDTPTCGEIYLTWEKESYTKNHEHDPGYKPITDPAQVDLANEERFEHKPYDYDTFISGIVWNENNDAKDVDNDIVYQAMAVIERSRLIAELPNNCVVLKEYNAQAQRFVELDGSEVKYNEITKAVAASKGIIITRNKQSIKAKYEPFTYTYKRYEDNEEFKRSFYYHMAHKNNEEIQRIPANWVDDLEQEKGVEIPKQKVTESEIRVMSSFSLYGAKYYIEKINVEYDLYRILKYYFGQDIDFYTIDPNAISDGDLIAIGGTDCMWWPVGSYETSEGEDGILYAKGTPASVRITSYFGHRGGVGGVPSASKDHKAIDIGGPHGNYPEGIINIIASADGVVKEVVGFCVHGNQGCGHSWGNYILIDHGNGISTRYAHLYSLSVNVGERVKQGQVIGKMGNTGASSATHLHFEVIDNGTRVDPLNYVSPIDYHPEHCGLTPPSVIPIPSSGDGKESICVAFLNAGYSPAQTAGVMVNAYEESRFDPSAFNPSGGGIGAYGLFQWRSGRQSSLKALSNYNTAQVQAAYALSELNSSESTAKKYLLASNNASTSAYNFCKYFERPGSDSYCTGRQNNDLVNEFYTYASNGCK